MGGKAMGTCSGISALQLSSAALLFLFAVLWLDVYWVKVKAEPQLDPYDAMLARQSWLNRFIATGAAMAAVLLVVWVHSCSAVTL
jgi:hypothetical protein